MGFKAGSREDPERSNLRKEQSAWVRLMGPGESVSAVYRLGRTTFLFTHRRMILVEEGATGRQVEYLSVPYRCVSAFAVEASGAFNDDADLKIWLTGRTAPVEKQFGPGTDVYAVQGLLAQYCAGPAGH